MEAFILVGGFLAMVGLVLKLIFLVGQGSVLKPRRIRKEGSGNCKTWKVSGGNKMEPKQGMSHA